METVELPACKDFIVSAIRRLRKQSVAGMPVNAKAGISLDVLHKVVSLVYDDMAFANGLSEAIAEETIIVTGRCHGPRSGRILISTFVGCVFRDYCWYRSLEGKWIERPSRDLPEHAYEHISEIKAHVLEDGLPPSIVKNLATQRDTTPLQQIYKDALTK